MTTGLLIMTNKELDRIGVIKNVIEKRIKQIDAMKVLGLSKRQVIRLVKDYRRDGESALISKHRGKIGSNAHSSALKLQVKEAVESRYPDFGPTFAAEKLLSIEKIKINKETLRQWMSEWGLWVCKPKKILKLHQTRERRSSLGELIQIDGSHHDWFEGRREKCCLLVFIDDATSRIVGLRFEEAETTAGYFTLCRSYIEFCGRPLAFYSDKFGVFRVNLPGQEEKETQFGRAMTDLGIELICAHSPQAKGRVERANQTLQDRLIKEMRLRGINTIDAANAYLPEFTAEHNHHFEVEPKNNIDMHRIDMPDKDTLDLIFSCQYTRTLSKQLEINYDKRSFKIQVSGNGYRLQNQKVTVCENINGQISILSDRKALNFIEYEKQNRAPEIIDSKGIEKKVNTIVQRIKHAPKANHPWKQYKAVADRKSA